MNFGYRTVDFIFGPLEVVLRIGEFLLIGVVGVRSSCCILFLTQIFFLFALFLTAFELNRLKVSATVVRLFDSHLC